jgi:hypothetical protein
MSDLWFPGANTSHKAPQDGGSIVSGYAPKVLWHDTETTGLPSYSTGYFPNMTICNGTPYQHIPANRAGRALKNPSGGVETNRGNVFQIEVCGYANKVAYHPVMTEVSEWLREVRGTPLECSVKWKSYPDSYGATSVRLSGSAWKSYTGHLGHQHAPENDHGDPGWPFPIDQILQGSGDDDLTPEEHTWLENINKGLIAQGTTTANATIDIMMARIRNNEKYIGQLCEQAGIPFTPVDTSQFS